MQVQNLSALNLWRDVTNLSLESYGPELTARQTALLLTIHLDSESHTVRSLSQKLGLQKPAISRALDSLSALGLIKRVRDENDHRSIFVEETELGLQRLEQFAEVISSKLKAA